jgi:hypothetical protein
MDKDKQIVWEIVRTDTGPDLKLFGVKFDWSEIPETIDRKSHGP